MRRLNTVYALHFFINKRMHEFVRVLRISQQGENTIQEQLGFYAGLHARGDADLPSVLVEVGLARQAELPCRYLSAGQRRRLALARLLVSGRPLWLLDEPFASLDTAGQALVGQLMARHCGEGGIIIAATHDKLGLGNASIRL